MQPKRQVLHDAGGNCEVVLYTLNGQLHREDGPALVARVSNQIIEEYWCRHGEYDREDGPALISRANGQIIEEYWFRRDELDRKDGPAYIEYADGRVCEKAWYLDDQYHRENGPAIEEYLNGVQTNKYWYLFGELQREEVYEDGVLAVTYIYRDGKLCVAGELASIQYHNRVDINLRDAIGALILFNRHRVSKLDDIRDAIRGDAIHDAIRALPTPIRAEIAWHYCYQ